MAREEYSHISGVESIVLMKEARRRETDDKVLGSGPVRLSSWAVGFRELLTENARTQRG